MQFNQVHSHIGVTASRAATISRQLFRDVPGELTEQQVGEMSRVAEYMKSNGIRSVRAAIAGMTESVTPDAAEQQQATPNVTSTDGLNGVFAGVVDAASTQYADMVTAGIIQSTMAKIGSPNGQYTAQAIENFTQGVIPAAIDLESAGMVLPGCSPQSQLLLSASATE